MALTSDTLEQARKAGYSDDEIYAHLADPRLSHARAAGYSLDDVAKHYDSQAALTAMLPKVQEKMTGDRPVPTGLQGTSTLTGQPVSGSTDLGVAGGREMNVEAAGATPLLKLPRIAPPGPNVLDSSSGQAADWINGIAGAAESLTTPKSAGVAISVPAIAAMSPLAATAVAVGFLGYTAEQFPKQLEDAQSIQDPHQRREATAGVVANAGAALLPEFHLANPEVLENIGREHDALQKTDPEQAQAYAKDQVQKIIQQQKAAAAGLPQTAEAISQPKAGELDEKGNNQQGTLNAPQPDSLHEGDVPQPGQPAKGNQPGTGVQGAAQVSPVKPALIVNGKPEIGQPGETHAQIALRVIRDNDTSTGIAAMDALGDDKNHVFVDQTGKVLDRTQGAQAALESGQITPEQHQMALARTEATGLHSEDLNQKGGADEKETTNQGRQEEVKGGVYPQDQIAAESHIPEEAEKISPQALGIVHPLPGFLQKIADWFSNPPTAEQLKNKTLGAYRTAMGQTMAKTTIADRESGEAGARVLSSKIAAPYLARTFSSSVLEGTGVDPVKYGAALTEDNLRSVKQSALDRAKAADAEGNSDEAAKAREEAAKVATVIGGQKAPFANEADYQAFLKDPATQQAIDKHRALWGEVIDPMFKNAQMLDPDEKLPERGQQTGARVNLFADDGTTKGAKVTTAGSGNNLLNTLRKKSPFGVQAKGTGTAYNVDYHQLMENTFARQLEIANKNAYETQLVKAGHAAIDKPGQGLMMPDGEETKEFPLKRQKIVTEGGKSFSQNQSIYIRKSLAGEYARANNLDRIPVPSAWKATANVLNQSALAGLTDASVHVLNLGTAMFTRPSVAGSLISDSLLSMAGRADVPVTIIKSLVKGFKNNQEQLSQLAEIGALREPHASVNPMAKVIGWADRTARLVLDDAFQSMAKSGLVKDTETNRREYVNQVGQYNKRAQSDLMRLARDTGIAPFATAGKTFNALGVRMMLSDPGATATSGMAAAALRANVLSKWVGASVLVGAFNYMLTKDKGGGVMGRPGVPIGNIDTGNSDRNGRPLSLPIFAALGLTRALRVTGVRGVMEAERRGLTAGDAMDQAARDVVNSAISPFAGPIVRFGMEAATGDQPAINVGRATPVAAPGKSQTIQNLKQAAIDANPIVKSISLARQPGGSVADAVRQQIPRLSMQPSNPPDMMANYPEIVHKAQASAFIDDTVGRARKLEQGPVRDNYIKSQLSKLTPQDQEHALEVLKYRRITWAGTTPNSPKQRTRRLKASR